MTILGGDALGARVLGEIGDVDPRGGSFSAWSGQQARRCLTAALIATTGAGFLAPPPARAIVFSGFSDFAVPARQTKKSAALTSTVMRPPALEVVSPPGGSSTPKLSDPRKRRGIERVKKELPPPPPRLDNRIPLPPFRTVLEPRERPPAPIIYSRPIIPEMEAVGKQIARAHAESDLRRQDEQDIADIADILSLLD